MSKKIRDLPIPTATQTLDEIDRALWSRERAGFLPGGWLVMWSPGFTHITLRAPTGGDGTYYSRSLLVTSKVGIPEIQYLIDALDQERKQ